MRDAKLILPKLLGYSAPPRGLGAGASASVVAQARPSSRWRSWRLVLIPVAAAALVVGFEWQGLAPQGAPANAAVWPKPAFGPASFANKEKDLDAQLALARERVRFAPGEWLREETLARAIMARAQITGAYDELVAARNIIASAQKRAPAPAGPLLTKAALALGVHRLDEAEQALNLMMAAAAPPTSERVEALAMAGDVRFYRGQIDGARRLYARAQAIDPGADMSVRLAILAKAEGRFDEAIALFSRAGRSGRAAPFQLASLAMHIGGVEMARGDYAAAREWFVRADGLFSGFWLFEAHLAQAEALDGNMTVAIGQLRGLAMRSGSPEVMDALAVYLRSDGKSQESRMWAARAARVWQRRLEQLPEAAYGHAFEHALAFKPPERLLQLAEGNVAARPFGEAFVMMGEALLANDKPAEALTYLDRAAASGWRSAPLFALRAEAFDTLGRTREARVDRARVNSLNPRFLGPQTGLIRFSHP